MPTGNLPGPTRRALDRLGFADWGAFASLSDAEVADLSPPLTGRDIDALGLDAGEDGEGLLRDADGMLASWRMPAPAPATDPNTPPTPEAEPTP